MQDSDSLIYNGVLYPSGSLLISPNNRSFRYGDGFFETMKMIDGNIIFQDFHFERLFASVQTMQFDKPDFLTPQFLLQQINLLAEKNNLQQLARFRINIFRGDGSLHDTDNQPNYIIQSWALQDFPSYNQPGISISLYKDARKATDSFSHIKSNNYLPYAMAALWCKTNGFDDALLLNCYGRIAEATTSNIFIVKENTIKTPALTEGCIAGVTRRYLLSCMQRENISCEETQITVDEVMKADEIFLTNTGFYIQWVKQCNGKIYSSRTSEFLYKQFIIPLLKNK